MKGTEFKMIREELGLTQEQLSEVLCLAGKKVISNIERGSRNPSLLTVVLMRLLSRLSGKKAKELQLALVSLRQEIIGAKGGRK